jgi:hypothetical protein
MGLPRGAALVEAGADAIISGDPRLLLPGMHST